MSQDDAPTSRGRAFAAMFFFLVIALVGRLCYLAEPFDGDSSMFIYMGKMTAAGGVVGRSVIDNKLPTVGYLLTGPWSIFGMHWWPYVFLSAAVSIASAFCISRIAAEHLGERSRRPTLLFALVYFNITAVVYAGFQLETFQMFFSILAAGAGMRAIARSQWRDAFTSGVCAAMAMMFKPSGAAVAVALLMTLLLRRRTIGPTNVVKLAASILLGMIVVLALMTLPLVRRDAIGSTLDLIAQIRGYAGGSVRDPAGDAVKLSTVFAVLAFPFIVCRLLAPPTIERSNSRSTLAAMAVFWFALELAGILLQGRMYAYHFLVLAAPAALAFGLMSREATRGNWRVLSIALAPALLISAWGAARVLIDASPQRWPARLAISGWFSAHATASDAIWIDDGARVLLETNCRPASAVLSTFLFANDDHAPTRLSSRLLADFRATEPTYIVLPVNRQAAVRAQVQSILELSQNPGRRSAFQSAWFDLFTYVDARYTVVDIVGQQVIWQRRRTP